MSEPKPSVGAVDGGSHPSTGDRAELRRRWQALAVCLLVGFMSLLDVSIVNVALPSIERGIHASSADLSWVLSGYALTFGLTLIPAGVLGDLWGRRTVFLVGLCLFTAASAACGLAPTATVLVLARLVQGAGGGLLGPQISGLIQQMFTGAVRARAFGYFGTTVGLATAVGPLAGGLLINAAGEQTGWRWVFFVNLPIGVLAFALALRLIPRGTGAGIGAGIGTGIGTGTRTGTRTGTGIGGTGAGAAAAGRPDRRIDWVGVLLLALGLVAILLPLVQEQQWHGSAKWLLLPVGALVLAGFVGWERRVAAGGRRTPLVDLSLFAIRCYTFGVTLGLLYFAGFTTVFFIFTLYLQSGLGYSALGAGLAITPFALGSAVSALVGGRWVATAGRTVILVGLVAVLVGTGLAALAVQLVPGHGAGWATAAPLLVAGIGSGLVIAPNQSLALAEVPVARAGTAGGILQTGQRLGSSLGIAVVGAVFFGRLGAGHDWAGAFKLGLLVALGFEAAALLCALADRHLGTRRPPGSGS